MIGMVLAAGAGRRLGEDTAELPKTLLTVDGERTILDVALGNFAAVGLEEAVIVTGFASERIDERLEALQERHGLLLEHGLQPEGARVEQRLLAVVRARALRPRRAARQRRHGAPVLGRAGAAGLRRAPPTSCSRSTSTSCSARRR